MQFLNDNKNNLELFDNFVDPVFLNNFFMNSLSNILIPATVFSCDNSSFNSITFNFTNEIDVLKILQMIKLI